MLGSWSKTAALGLVLVGHVAADVFVRTAHTVTTTTSSAAAACSTPVVPAGCTTTASGPQPTYASVSGFVALGNSASMTVSGSVVDICAGGQYSLTIPYVAIQNPGYTCSMVATLGGATLTYDSSNIYANFVGGSSNTLAVSITVTCTHSNANGDGSLAGSYFFNQGQVSFPFVATPCGGTSTSLTSLTSTTSSTAASTPTTSSTYSSSSSTMSTSSSLATPTSTSTSTTSTTSSTTCATAAANPNPPASAECNGVSGFLENSTPLVFSGVTGPDCAVKALQNNGGSFYDHTLSDGTTQCVIYRGQVGTISSPLFVRESVGFTFYDAACFVLVPVGCSSTTATTTSLSTTTTTATLMTTTLTTTTSFTTSTVSTISTTPTTSTTTTAGPGSTCTAVANPPGSITCGGHGYLANTRAYYLSDDYDASSFTSPVACYEACLSKPGCVMIGFIQGLQCEFYSASASQTGFTADNSNPYNVWDAACFSCSAPQTTTSTTSTATSTTTTSSATTSSTTTSTTTSISTSTTTTTSTTSATTTTAAVSATTCTAVANPPGFLTCGQNGYLAGALAYNFGDDINPSSLASPAACYLACQSHPACQMIGFIQGTQCEFYDGSAGDAGFLAANTSPFNVWDAGCFSCGVPTTTTSSTTTSALSTTSTTTTTASTTASTTSTSSTLTTTTTTVQSTSTSAMSTSSSSASSSTPSPTTTSATQSNSTSSSAATSSIVSSTTSAALTTSTITATNTITISTCASTITNCPYTTNPITTVSITTYTTVCPVATAVPPSAASLITLTITSTRTYTITACAPGSSCALGSLTSAVVVYTTTCPITISTVYSTVTSTLPGAAGKITTVLVPVGTTTVTLTAPSTTLVPAQGVPINPAAPSANANSGNAAGSAVRSGMSSIVTVGVAAPTTTTSGSMSTSTGTGTTKVAAGGVARVGFPWLGGGIAAVAAMIL